MVDASNIRAVLNETLMERGFRPRTEAADPTGASPVVACWTRRTIFTNRAAVVLRCPEAEDPAQFARASRRSCAKAAGFYVPVLYGIGLQVIVLGPGVQTPLEDAVDRIDNQWCVLQAIHVVDMSQGTVTSASTWGQVISGPDQQAVATALQRALA